MANEDFETDEVLDPDLFQLFSVLNKLSTRFHITSNKSPYLQFYLHLQLILRCPSIATVEPDLFDGEDEDDQGQSVLTKLIYTQHRLHETDGNLKLAAGMPTLTPPTAFGLCFFKSQKFLCDHVWAAWIIRDWPDND